MSTSARPKSWTPFASATLDRASASNSADAMSSGRTREGTAGWADAASSGSGSGDGGSAGIESRWGLLPDSVPITTDLRRFEDFFLTAIGRSPYSRPNLDLPQRSMTKHGIFKGPINYDTASHHGVGVPGYFCHS